jgi:hypothetical protein
MVRVPALPSHSLTVSQSPLLLAGVPDWIAVGIVGMVVALLLGRVAWQVVMKDDGWLGENEGDPLAETAVGLVPEEVARIVDACRREARAVLMLVEAAQRTISLDDYQDALAGARRRQEQLVRTLGELQREVGKCSVLSAQSEADKSVRAPVSESQSLPVSKSKAGGGV